MGSEKLTAEHCTVESIFNAFPPEYREYLAEYLKPFAQPLVRENATEGSGFALGNQLCLKCGSGLDGMFGTFAWGLAHGEGRCSKCKWPARAYHYLKLGENEERVSLVLQYHPDFVEERAA